MLTRWMLVCFGIITAVFFTGACSRSVPAEFVAPDFTMEDLMTGKNIQLSQYRGRPVLLYFFASW